MPAVRFDSSAIGTWTEQQEFEVTRERIVDYAAATNDPFEQHLSGDVAPPVFAIVPVFGSLLPAALSVAPPEIVPYILHSEQEFLLHRQIRPGTTLISRARPIGYEGGAGGTRCAVHLDCHDKSTGELVTEQWVTFFVRKQDAGETVGELAPAHRGDDSDDRVAPLAKVVQHVDEDQTFRYAPAAGDPMPIHLDDDVAKAAGLPGIIVHGLCTMAFTSWAVVSEVADGRPERLRRLAVRFTKPVRPGADLRTEIRRAGVAGGNDVFSYQTTVGGEAVIKDGLAEVSS